MQQINFRIPKAWVSQMEKIAVSEGIRTGKPFGIADLIRNTLQKTLLLPGEYVKYQHKKGK